MLKKVLQLASYKYIQSSVSGFVENAWKNVFEAPIRVFYIQGSISGFVEKVSWSHWD